MLIGLDCRADTHLLDIAPTVLDLLGIAEPTGMRGRSLLPSLAHARP